MKCILFLVEEFDENNSICKQCEHFQKCKETNQIITDKNYGENYPNYETIQSYRNTMYMERVDMVKKLLTEQINLITIDDIIDLKIDLGLYNDLCKKKRKKK